MHASPSAPPGACSSTCSSAASGAEVARAADLLNRLLLLSAEVGGAGADG